MLNQKGRVGDIFLMSDIIKDIANILQYFVPGFIGIQVFKFCASKKVSDKYEIILCCVFSYVMNAFCELAHGKFTGSVVLASVYGKVVVSSVAFSIICLFCAWLIQRPLFEKICVDLFHVSPRSDLLDGVLDKPEATNIRVYLKDGKGSVYGHYAGRDDDSSDKWIAITEPTVFSKDGSKQDFDKEIVYLVRISDIDHMIVE